MTKVSTDLIERFAELSPVLDDSDASENPEKVVKQALTDGIDVLSEDSLREISAIEAEQARLKEKSAGEKSRESFVNLSEEDDDKSVSEIQASLKRRIFNND